MGDVTNVIVARPRTVDARGAPRRRHRSRPPVAVPPLPPAGHAGVVLPGSAPAARRDRRVVRVPRGVGRDRATRGCPCAGTCPSRSGSKRTARRPSTRSSSRCRASGRRWSCSRCGALPHGPLVGEVPRREHRDHRRDARPPAARIHCSRSSSAATVPISNAWSTATARRSRVATSWRRWRCGAWCRSSSRSSRAAGCSGGSRSRSRASSSRRSPRAGSTSACTGPRTSLAGLLLGSFFLLGIEAVLGYAHRISGCGGAPRHESDARARAS